MRLTVCAELKVPLPGEITGVSAWAVLLLRLKGYVPELGSLYCTPFTW